MLYLQFTIWKWQVHRRITNFFTVCTKFKVRAKCRAKKTLTKVILLMSINTQFELTSFQSYYFFPIPKINPTSKKIKNCLFLIYYLFEWKTENLSYFYFYLVEKMVKMAPFKVMLTIREVLDSKAVQIIEVCIRFWPFLPIFRILIKIFEPFLIGSGKSSLIPIV